MVDGNHQVAPADDQVVTPPDEEPVVVDVPIGRRVVVVANLLLGPQATPSSTEAGAGVARALDTWEGPGTVIVAGNLVDLHEAAADEAAARTQAALDAHPRLAEALRGFAAGAERAVYCLPGADDAALSDPDGAGAAVARLGLRVAHDLELRLHTTAGERIVHVMPTAPAQPADDDPAPTTDAGGGPEPEWRRGAERLADPGSLQRFVTSRQLYRRLAPQGWWMLAAPFVVAVVIGVPVIAAAIGHVFGHGHIERVEDVRLGDRLLYAAMVAALVLVSAVAVTGAIARRSWRRLGGRLGAGPMGGLFDDELTRMGATTNDAGRDEARAMVAGGAAGVVSGATLQAELTNLGAGFFASTGAAGEVVEEEPGRMGLPPVFVHHRQVAWIELETGAELHARLLLARTDERPPTLLERVAARHGAVHDGIPVVVAAFPRGASWPPAPDLTSLRRRSRRVRRWTALAIAVTGLLDLLTAITPPLRGRLHAVQQVLPLGAAQTAGALVAVSGLGLLALARGVRRGQRRAWALAVALLAGSLVLHLARDADIGAWVVSAAVLALLVGFRHEFRASSDSRSLRSALVAVGGAAVGVVALASFIVELTLSLRHVTDGPGVLGAVTAVTERLVYVRSVPIPGRFDHFLSPVLATIGVSLATVALWLVSRPVVDRRRNAGRVAESRARDIVMRHGAGTLDYFALRGDKQLFFHRDSLVAYGVFGGVCLVSPDPIGPVTEREQVWSLFRRFAESRGLVVAVMGASEEWLPIYRACGMHDIYIGDEAVVDVQRFSLAGGRMKGLRQAHNRVAKYGYTATMHDPAHLDAHTAEQLAWLMTQSRRGEAERGFSMMLGRIFASRDQGLILCAVWDPEGRPAAMCQFVPAPGIGGYSLDLMRRDRGEHPNGLIDFALCSTIEHLRQRGAQGLSLNFAALRSVLDGERGDGVTQRIERWALKKMSSFVQIETLWRFNAKYEPDWLPRYVIYDTAEHLVPAVLAILRAESLFEVPVVGKVIAGIDKRAQPADLEVIGDTNDARDGDKDGESDGVDTVALARAARREPAARRHRVTNGAGHGAATAGDGRPGRRGRAPDNGA